MSPFKEVPSVPSRSGTGPLQLPSRPLTFIPIPSPSFPIHLQPFISLHIASHRLHSIHITLRSFPSLPIASHHLHPFTSLPIALHHFPSINIAYRCFPSLPIASHRFTSFTSLHITLRPFPSLPIASHRFRSLHIICINSHRLTSLPIALHRFLSLLIVSHPFIIPHIASHHFPSLNIPSRTSQEHRTLFIVRGSAAPSVLGASFQPLIRPFRINHTP